MTAYVGSGAFPSRHLADILAAAEDWGVARLELSSDIAPAPDAGALARAARARFDLLLHNYFPAPEQPFVLNIAATDPDVLRRSRDHCRLALDLSAEIEAPVFAAHAGLLLQPRHDQLGRSIIGAPLADRETAWSIFVDSVGMLIAHGRRRGVAFLVENNVAAPFNVTPQGHPLLLADPPEILRAARDVGADFGLLLDVAHLKVSAATLGFDAAPAMAELSGVTRAYHLSDNDGTRDDNRPFDARSWFLPLLDRRLPATVEVTGADRTVIDGCLALLGGSE